MNAVAVIPARGGSKGVPLKNIRLLGGVPLLAHAIRAARASDLVGEVYVSTDSDLIAEVAAIYGAQVLRRSPELSRDETSSEAVLLDALNQLAAQGSTPELLVFLQCTAPFMTAGDIDGTINKLLRSGSQSAFAAAPFEHFAWAEDAGGARGLNHDGLTRRRRQDLDPQYLEAGSVYVMRTAAFMQEQTRFCGRTAIYVMDSNERLLEIDTPCDFYLAQALARWLGKSQSEREQFRVRQTDIERRLRCIRAAVFDFDGVFTDGGVWVDQQGREQVRCSRLDGMGIARLRGHTQLKLLVLSGESSTCGARRCAKLGLEFIGNCQDKASALDRWAEEQDVAPEEILYCGDDVADLPLAHRVDYSWPRPMPSLRCRTRPTSSRHAAAVTASCGRSASCCCSARRKPMQSAATVRTLRSSAPGASGRSLSWTTISASSASSSIRASGFPIRPMSSATRSGSARPGAARPSLTARCCRWSAAAACGCPAAAATACTTSHPSRI